MLFFSFMRTLIGHKLTVELKNDVQITGKLKMVDEFMNLTLDEVGTQTDDGGDNSSRESFPPHLASVKSVFIRGSVVRFVHLPSAGTDSGKKDAIVDLELLHEATRREHQDNENLMSKVGLA